MNAPAVIPTRPEIGAAMHGGILLGRYFVEDQPFLLIGARKADLAKQGLDQCFVWNGSTNRVAGALSVYDGLANTRAMAKAGSEIAQRLLAAEIHGHRDWFLWSRGEALLGLDAQATLPAQERFEPAWYWTSTQDADGDGDAWVQSFNGGYQDWNHKSLDYRVFAVRREPIR